MPVRLGDLNAQTRWVLERSGAPAPEFLPHVMLRACDVMREAFPVAHRREPVRDVGLAMANDNLDLVPIVDDDGVLAGVMTIRALARRYIRESREASSLGDAATTVEAVVRVLEGEMVAGEDQELDGRIWVSTMAIGSSPAPIGAGDVMVVGDREDAQRRALELGVSLLVVPNSSVPSKDILALAEGLGTTVVISPLDAYVTARMITLAAPVRGADGERAADREPRRSRVGDLRSDQGRALRRRGGRGRRQSAASASWPARTSWLPPRRRIMLVDHAELAQSVPGADEADILEILDHHHIGSIETHVPVTATFDPVGSTATLVIERFRQNGLEPARPTAMLLLGAILSDTVILNSPTTTERDHAVVDYLEKVLALDATEFGREMFEATSDVSQLPAEKVVTRDAKEYGPPGGRTMCIAQIETVGKGLLERQAELTEAMEEARTAGGHVLFALMITDILSKGTDLLVAGDRGLVERAFGQPSSNGALELPGVMSRKKQVAPPLLAVL